jgi:predicted flap endonuclease-1-like 5' DNA nuclease
MDFVDADKRAGMPTTVARKAATRYALPISKLHQVPYRARLALKVHRITTCEQLLAAAGAATARAALARAAQVEPEVLDLLVRRADMARVHGIGVVFGLMLEDLGVADVASIAACDPVELHERLRRYNGEERRARRSPTPEEVAEWVVQARGLPVLVS